MSRKFLAAACLSASLLMLSFSALYAAPIGVRTFEPGQIKMQADSSMLQSALDQLNAGKYDEAIKTARLAADKNPNLAPAYEIIGAALVMKGNIDEGLKELQKAVKINPGQSTAITKIGDIYLAQNKINQAKEQYLKAVKLSPDDRIIHQRLGMIYEKEGKTKQAIDEYEKGLIGTPANYVGIKVNLASLYNQTKQYNKAIALLSPVITSSYKEATAHIVLGTSYMGVNKTDAAISEFENARTIEPNSERTNLSLGIAYREKGRYNDSLNCLKIAVNAAPKNSINHFQLGRTLFSMKKYDEALGEYKKAEAINPSDRFTKISIAEIYIEKKQYSAAIDIYNKILKSGKGDLQVYDLLGTAYQLNAQNDLAKKTYLEMVKKYPSSSFAYYKLGHYCPK